MVLLGHATHFHICKMRITAVFIGKIFVRGKMKIFVLLEQCLEVKILCGH